MRIEAANTNLLFYLLMAASILVSRIPYVGKYLRVVHTLVHESGHGIMAMLTSGNVQSIELFASTEGKATTTSSNAFSRFLQALAGYPATSLTAWMFFFWIQTEQTALPLFVILGIGLICLILFIRNIYGIFWLLSFCALLIFIVYRQVKTEEYIAAVIISSLILIDSFIYPFHLLYISINNPAQAGDAKNLKDMTHIPAFFWACIFVLFSGFMTWKTLQLFPSFATL